MNGSKRETNKTMKPKRITMIKFATFAKKNNQRPTDLSIRPILPETMLSPLCSNPKSQIWISTFAYTKFTNNATKMLHKRENAQYANSMSTVTFHKDLWPMNHIPKIGSKISKKSLPPSILRLEKVLTLTGPPSF